MDGANKDVVVCPRCKIVRCAECGVVIAGPQPWLNYREMTDEELKRITDHVARELAKEVAIQGGMNR